VRPILRDSIERRKSLYSPGTNTLRLVHGQRDGLPGLYLDDFAGHWLLQSPQRPTPGQIGSVMDVAEESGAQSLFLKVLAQEEKAAPEPLWGSEPAQPFEIRENGLSYWADFHGGYSQGFFLDQRENRKRLRDVSRGQSVLNTFAYTCSFSVAAAKAGAETVSLDLSKPYLDWGRRNFSLNDLEPVRPQHDFIFGDVFEWLKRLANKPRRFDVIILDPPTFSRSKRGKAFRAGTHYPDLVELAGALLKPEGGQLLCCTNQLSLSLTSFENLLQKGVKRLGAQGTLRARPMPADFAGDDYLKNVWVDLQF
jgi:23S rRNA (cytosine1962-C5)-methyltransferase